MHARRTHPTRLVYPETSRVQCHVCPSGRIADALVQYIGSKYKVRPSERIRDTDVRIDPGGMAFTDSTRYTLATLPYSVSITAEHVGRAHYILQAGTQTDARRNLGGVEVVRFQMFHHALALPPDHVPVILEWLTGLLSEAAAATDLRLQAIREAGAGTVISVGPGRVIGQA